MNFDLTDLDLYASGFPHLAFGHGVHYRLGAILARLEIRLLLPRFEVEMTGPPVYTGDSRLFGLEHLPTRLTPRTGDGPTPGRNA